MSRSRVLLAAAVASCTADAPAPSGSSSSATGEPPADGFVVEGERPEDGAGVGVAIAGDVNGDGNDDLIIGRGLVVIVFGRGAGVVSLRSLEDDEGGLSITGPDVATSFGLTLASDQTGVVLIGATGVDGGSGRAYLLRGAAGIESASIDEIVAAGHATELRGQIEGEGFGASLSMGGDVDGDALPDLAIGAPGVDAGRVYVMPTM